MATFDIVLVAGASVVDWSDPATDTSPTRLNSPRIPPRYYRVSAALPADIELKALVGGAELDDVAIGYSFSWAWAQIGGGPVPGFIWTPPNSFHPTVTFRPRNVGLWLIRATLPLSGSVLFGINVEPA